MRIYRPTPNAQFIMDNDVDFQMPGKILTIPQKVFYHYNYVKLNKDAFWRKMAYQAEQDPTFNQRILPQMNFDEAKKQYKINDDIPIYDFTGKHPLVMKNHPYFINDVFNDGPLEFLSE